ncbi:AAA family ATPase [Coxiella-like endosymbiont]|uniref:AAA family ATPase n=1 Tax=Coxiella-like endosymbiont TaxID=1592897 RepID=UPI0034E2DC37
MGLRLNSNNDSGVNRRVLLSEFLVQMDERSSKNENIFVIGATNAPDILDRSYIKAPNL